MTVNLLSTPNQKGARCKPARKERHLARLAVLFSLRFSSPVLTPRREIFFARRRLTEGEAAVYDLSHPAFIACPEDPPHEAQCPGLARVGPGPPVRAPLSG